MRHRETHKETSQFQTENRAKVRSPQEIAARRGALSGRKTARHEGGRDLRGYKDSVEPTEITAEEFLPLPRSTPFVYLASSLFTLAVRLLASKGARTFASLSK
jgi:hypothetical protein